jgi:tRNA nucleotidyltransferase (CCA-adding enzyme)
VDGPGSAGAPDPRPLEAKVRARIAPSPELLDRVARARRSLSERAEAFARAKGIPLVRAVVAGSAARGTFLVDRVDIDLFLLFRPDLAREALEQEGLRLARELLDAPEMRYAEHPYLRGRYEGFQVDAVPGYAVEDPAHPLSAVDRTPFHHAYLSERQRPEHIEETRLAKQFFRAQGIYGSEARTQGLSGYVVELLILRFGTLDEVLRAARGFRVPTRLVSTPGSQPRVPEGTALVIDDPVDPHRNVASALSRRNFSLLVLAAQAYLERPDERFFRAPSPVRIDRASALARAAERGTHIAGLTLPRPPFVDDIVYPQLAKAARSLSEEAERTGFRVVGSAFAASEGTATVLLEVSPAELPRVRVHDGPPPGLARVDQFLAKWADPGAAVLQGPYVAADGRLAVDVRRAVREAEPILTELLPRVALGRDLARVVGPSTAFYPLEGAPSVPELEEALGELLDKRLPWRREAP